ncbi:MAG: CinA family nicotinamide mononucleotide deamidase-related protein [Acidobacteria bacterium]|nr:CinA family nicotinamide mononucleotide deamidase-related protein [Candidatus Sulfomarinibacter kjeldsenii]MBD3856172.1 CinA family nicotinamide mononucleotide deamidase-related protein [Candidatus Sulfomarinibacter kjeldsenii]
MSEARRKAACLAVGSELLGDHRLDSNSLTITRALANHGVTVDEKRVAGDSVERVAEAIRELFDRHDLVVVTGGLGPTADDVTRDAVARAFDREIALDTEVEGWIRARYAELGREMPEICTTMARVVAGSRPLRNDRGSAPGLLFEEENRLLAVFPGVPWEMEEMLERDLVPEIAGWNPGLAKISRTLLLGGVVESDTEVKIRHLYDRFGREDITILASYGVLRLVLSAEGDESTSARQLDAMEAAFREVLGDDVAAVDVDDLPEVVLERLRRRQETLSVAESCTGGLLSAHLTDVAGASDVFLGGVVSYSNEAKEHLIDVPHETLVEHGAVSEEVACAMAEGVRARFGSNWGAGITGIAGPTGGTEEKPVGLVHWAVAGPDGISAKHHVFLGDRSIVRVWSLNATLDLLRRRLLALEG